jgi:hypothetical protein
METFRNGLLGLANVIRETNRKYRTPRIKMTPMVRLSLLLLRAYLIGMILLLIYKFVTVVAGR